MFNLKTLKPGQWIRCRPEDEEESVPAILVSIRTSRSKTVEALTCYGDFIVLLVDEIEACGGKVRPPADMEWHVRPKQPKITINQILVTVQARLKDAQFPCGDHLDLENNGIYVGFGPNCEPMNLSTKETSRLLRLLTELEQEFGCAIRVQGRETGFLVTVNQL